MSELKLTTVKVRLTGTQPLLLHADNIDWSDQMEEWRKDPENKKKSKAGDDRTPPYRWLGCLTYDDPQKGHVAIQAEYLMKTIMQGAAMVSAEKGKGSLKSESQSGIMIAERTWPLIVNGHKIPMAELQKMRSLKTFAEHTEAVKALDFSLFVKRASIGTSKHVRVRPRFETGWSCEGHVVLVGDTISLEQLKKILDNAGRFKGIGSWRPGGKTPGQFGTFQAKIL